MVTPKEEEIHRLREEVGDLRTEIRAFTERFEVQQAEMLRQHDEVKRALWGPENEQQRKVEPGIVSVVYTLNEQSKSRQAVSGFLKVAVGTIGVGNVALLIAYAFRLLAGGSG